MHLAEREHSLQLHDERSSRPVELLVLDEADSRIRCKPFGAGSLFPTIRATLEAVPIIENENRAVHENVGQGIRSDTGQQPFDSDFRNKFFQIRQAYSDAASEQAVQVGA